MTTTPASARPAPATGTRSPEDVEVPPTASLPKAAWRAFGQFRRHQMTDNAAALTYYAMLSLFPLLVAATSILSLAGDQDTVARFVNYLADQGADAETRQAVDALMTTIVSQSGGAVSAALVVSLLIALNGASGAFGAAGRALNAVHATEEERGFVRRKLVDLAMTLAVVVLLLVVAVSLFLGGGVAEDLFGEIGLGSTAATIWSVARWPAAVLAAILAVSIVYAFAPDVAVRRFRWLSPGAVAGVLVWIGASFLFGIYLQSFSSYGAAYGVFGAALVLLLWLWISSCAFLLGAELNAEIERTETAGRGGPPLVTPPPLAMPGPDAPAASAPRAASRAPSGPGT